MVVIATCAGGVFPQSTSAFTNAHIATCTVWWWYYIILYYLLYITMVNCNLHCIYVYMFVSVCYLLHFFPVPLFSCSTSLLFHFFPAPPLCYFTFFLLHLFAISLFSCSTFILFYPFLQRSWVGAVKEQRDKLQQFIFLKARVKDTKGKVLNMLWELAKRHDCSSDARDHALSAHLELLHTPCEPLKVW